jgi:hypothetical protein
MKQEIKILPNINSFAEDKDDAKHIRVNKILPSLINGENVILDFSDVKFSTQSYIHALIGEPLKQYGEDLLDRIEFKSCSIQVKNVIELVVNYSLSGFESKKK